MSSFQVPTFNPNSFGSVPDPHFGQPGQNQPEGQFQPQPLMEAYQQQQEQQQQPQQYYEQPYAEGQVEDQWAERYVFQPEYPGYLWDTHTQQWVENPNFTPERTNGGAEINGQGNQENNSQEGQNWQGQGQDQALEQNWESRRSQEQDLFQNQRPVEAPMQNESLHPMDNPVEEVNQVGHVNPVEDLPVENEANHVNDQIDMENPMQPNFAPENRLPPDVASSSEARPPDILLPTAERNFYMQTGQLNPNPEYSHEDARQSPERQVVDPEDDLRHDVRQPVVDGGNEDDEEIDLPLDRLVLGQSDQPQQLQPMPAPPPTQQNKNVLSVQERVVPGTSEEGDVGVPKTSSNPVPAVVNTSRPPSSAGATALSSPNKGPKVNSTEPLLTSTPTFNPPKGEDGEHSIRRETIGSDRRDESVMGPPPSGPNPPAGPRDVTGADSGDKVVNKKSKKKSKMDSGEEHSDDRSERHHRRHHRKSKHSHHRRRRSSSRSSSPHVTSEGTESDSESEQLKRRNSYKRSQRHRRRDDESPQRKKDHYRDKYHHQQKYGRDRRDRDYYENRGHRDEAGYDRSYYEDRRHPSRPSSRSGSIYEERYYMRDYMNPYMMHAAHNTSFMSMPSQAAMETFEKHWRYYMKNPNLFYQLRTSDPRQFESLNNYFRMCGDYLNLPPIGYPKTEIKTEENTVASSRASVHSGQSSVDGASEVRSEIKSKNIEPYVADPKTFHEEQQEASAIWTDPDADPRYQPTYIQDQQDESAVNQGRLTPNKFSSAHVMGAFGVRGHLAKVEAKSPLDGQAAIVELHSLQSLFSNDTEDFKAFPGPLIPGRTHKGEVIQFCQAKIAQSEGIPDKESYNLVWELMILLLRQKNAMDGNDLAELLLRGRDTEADKVRFDRAGISSNISTNDPNVTSKFRDFLLIGHKKEALDYAMRHGLWGHALFLASKMDDRSYSNVMLRFANGLAVNDPLQTLYQLMSGRQPLAVKECAEQHWGGDWRPHLAMILANPSGREELDRRSIMTLGDTLKEKGLLFAAHFCYLMARVDFGGYSDIGAKISLIGADRGASHSFEDFAANESIQLTEIFEYIQRLSNPDYNMPSMLYYKFIYALRLLDYGFSISAFDYLVEIAKTIVKSPSEVYGDRLDGQELIRQVLEIVDRLKYLDPSYTTREGEISEMTDPEWLEQLKQVYYNYAYGHQDYHQHHSEYDQNYAAEQHNDHLPESTNNEIEHQEDATKVDPIDEPIMMKPTVDNSHPPPPIPTFTPSSTLSAPPLPPGPPLMPVPVESSSEQTSSADVSPTHPPNNYFSQVRKTSGTGAPPTSKLTPPTPPVKQKKEEKKETKKQEEKSSAKPSVIGRLLGAFIKPPNQMHLPDDSDQSIVYDSVKQRWVDKNGDAEEDENGPAAPPSDMELSRTNSEAQFGDMTNSTMNPSLNNSMANNLAPNSLPPNNLAPPMGNKFAGGLAKKRGMSGRIDVFKKNQSAPVLSPDVAPPPMMLMPMPGPIPTSDPAPMNPNPPDANNSEQESKGHAPMFYNPNQFTAPS